jgi:hypothetical protein
LDEEFIKHEHQKLVQSLSESDAAELERLGHHGISGNLNHDKEADVSFEHELKNSALYKLSHPVPVAPISAVNNGWNAHPLATLFLALNITVISGFICFTSFQKPIDRQPALVQPWPSVIAKVIDTIVHNGRQETYDYTFEYRVEKTAYHFTEKGVGTPFAMSEVKYDPKAPNHYYRVPLDAEGVIPSIGAFIGLLLGLSFAWDGIAKWRSGSRSDIGPTLAFLILSISLMMLPIAYYVGHTKNAGTPYSIATPFASK